MSQLGQGKLRRLVARRLGRSEPLSGFQTLLRDGRATVV